MTSSSSRRAVGSRPYASHSSRRRAPNPHGEREPLLRVVHPPEQSPELRDDFVVRRSGPQRRLAFDIREHLAAAPVDRQEARRAVEPDRLEMEQERVHGLRAVALRPADGVVDADDGVLTDVHVAADERDLARHRSIRSPARSSRRCARWASSIACIVALIVAPG